VRSSAVQIRKLWERALPLWTALFKFSHPDIRARYDAAEEARPKFTELGSEDFNPQQDYGDGIMGGVGRFFEALQPVSDGLAQKGVILDEMKRNAIGYVREGHIRAYGYQEPRRLEDFPHLLPDDMWDGQINWERGAVSGHGLSFIEVRMMPTSWESTIVGWPAPKVCTTSEVSLFATCSEARFGRSPSVAKAGTGRWCRMVSGAGGL
jgi:hypothetical protein